jgi:hypothetical protein
VDLLSPSHACLRLPLLSSSSSLSLSLPLLLADTWAHINNRRDHPSSKLVKFFHLCFNNIGHTPPNKLLKITYKKNVVKKIK